MAPRLPIPWEKKLWLLYDKSMICVSSNLSSNPNNSALLGEEETWVAVLRNLANHPGVVTSVEKHEPDRSVIAQLSRRKSGLPLNIETHKFLGAICLVENGRRFDLITEFSWKRTSPKRCLIEGRSL